MKKYNSLGQYSDPKPIDKRLNIFELILKKCQNINKFEIKNEFDYKFTKTKYNQMIDIIIKNCNNLTHFDINFELISKKNQKNFLQKFGSKLIRSDSLIWEFSESILKSFNLEVLTIYSPFPQMNDLVFKRLDRLNICDLGDEDLDQLEVFIDGHKTIIKHFILENRLKKTINANNY